jgi:DNA-binding CsgD family transcriptional regulator/tetratricopeptide (TPR) repeat protein
VGRDRELAALEEAWAAADAGARQVLLVGGEAGSGKSRLAAEAATVLHRAGATVLVGACVADLGQPYQAFVEPFSVLLRAFAAGEFVDSEPPPGGRSIVEWLRMLTGAEDGADIGDTHRGFQRQLCAAAVAAIKTVAGRGPLVLVLEDLHWSGSAERQLFTYIVQRTAACRLLIVATHRDALPDRSSALVETIATVQGVDGVRRLDLLPLRSEDIADYLIREAGVSAERARSAAVSLRETTGGNPYFVGELWRDLRARGGLRALRDTVAAPASVRDAFDSRLRRLSPAAAEIAELAAVIGEEVEPTVLCAAAGRAVPEVLRAVDDCVGAGLLAAVADGDDFFRFTHALARKSVLELTPASARTRNHARVAEVIERLPATRGRVQRLAHHYAGAHTLGYADQAVRYLVEAARLADQGLAHSEAARLYERAAALTSEPTERDATLLNAVQQHTYAGDFVRARALAEEVATTGTDAQRLSAAIAFEAASWRPGVPGHRAVDVLTAVLKHAGSDMNDRDRSRVLAGLGRALAFTGAWERASAALTRAIELARAVGDDELLMDALSASLWERQTPRYAATVRERAVDLSTLARHYGDLVLLGPAAHHRAMTGYLLGAPDELESGHVELAGVAEATGQAYFEYFAGGVAYGRQFIAGDFAAAERSCTAQLRLGLSFGTDETNGPFGVQSFMVRRETGALDQVRPLITGEEDPVGFWAPGLLALYTEFGMRPAAARVMRWILDRDILCDETSAQWPMVLAFLTEAALALHDTTTAARLRPALQRYAGLNLVAEPFVALFGSADRYLGAVDSMLGQGDPEASLTIALDMDTRMAAPLHVAQTLAATVAHHRRTGADGVHVQELAGRARSIAEPLRLRRVLRTLDRAGATSRPAGLTDREVEVLRLISAGLGNREIGARLFITENTTANHVRSILAKTGASNRTQAARYATEHGLLA